MSDQHEEFNSQVINGKTVLKAGNADISGSQFICIKSEKLYFENVTLAGTKITDANLSDLEINGAQIGGAYIHNIGMPPQGHPAFILNEKQRAVRFENCDLNHSTITNCDLSNVEINDCNISGLKINGILVEQLLTKYAESM
ncbi:Pentapeptide repeat-containing protein [Paenibacillus sp. 1_12]|uniref:pentapeptide repeat-containing protein n=1 Tax=Paenibacillus sp. 1_12 TaxID=1566278 RepID=UPI0008E676F6|nr:pentapeptide repeat-containing protein [Paenibacillus sp. 1_12]SFL06202.1 Pentapeptide repeat-containing protein [Paenibacillus sp. 1_12]